MNGSFGRVLMLLCSMTLGACGDGGGTECARDTDCASGFCRADGTCGAPEVDAAPTLDAPPGDAPVGLCAPDHDGQIVRAELPMMAGRAARYRSAEDPTFATAGAAAGGGARRWDLSGALAGDQDLTFELLAPAGAWWASAFPTASYATRLSAASDLLGVFRVDDAAVTLLGVVSPAGGASRTELVYDDPIVVLALPLTATSTWSSESIVSGVASGVGGAYTERYASAVDATGTMVTPYGEFPVLRVATDLTRTSGFTTLATQRTFAWVAECFGPVANATSQSFETDDEFSDPAEVRRLAP